MARVDVSTTSDLSPESAWKLASDLSRFGDWIWLDVEADGFLYNMVRAIAGTLMNVGRGYWPESRVAEILEAGERKLAGPTAPASGLFLMRVTYE